MLADNRSYWENGAISARAKQYLQEKFLPDISGYDVIKGYRADDSYFSFAQAFVAGTLSVRKLNEAMRLGKLGEQVVLKSEKAFGQLEFCGFEAAIAEDYYAKKRGRDLEARRKYRNNLYSEETANDIYIIDIIREGIANGDPRLR